MPRRSEGRLARSGGLAVLALAAVAGITLALPAVALAASPSPTAGSGLGDPRSSGQGPGLVGDPLMAIAIVAAIAILTIVATLLYVRATARRPRA